MTDKETMKQALEALEPLVRRAAPWGEMDWLNGCKAITAIKEALAQPEPMAVYGYCPECGAKGVMRERRPNGNDKCANGHTYPSSTSTPPQRPRVVFPTMLRKMWSGSEVQAWLDENVNKENT